MGQGTNQEFIELVRFAPCGQGGAEATFVSGEAAFGLGAMAILPVRKAIVHHPAISPLGRAGSVSRIEWNDRAANAEFLAAQRVVVLGIVAFIAQQASGPKIDRRLSHCGGKVGRILAGTPRGHGADDQVRSGMKYRRELRPGSMHGLRGAAATLKVHRGVTCLQTGRIDRRGAVSVVDDQTAAASAVTTRGQQFRKPPFSRSFCSTYHSVEWSGILVSPKMACSSAHSSTIDTMPR